MKYSAATVHHIAANFRRLIKKRAEESLIEEFLKVAGAFIQPLLPWMIASFT